MTPGELQAWSFGYQRKLNRESWLYGIYTMYAVMAVISPLVADAKKGQKAFCYPNTPVHSLAPVTKEEQEKLVENERLKAKLYLDSIVKKFSVLGGGQQREDRVSVE